MSTEIVVALIGFAGSALGSVIGILASTKLTTYRIEQLEKKVEKHNNLVERVYHLEDDEKLVDEKIKVINHRLEDLEHNHLDH